MKNKLSLLIAFVFILVFILTPLSAFAIVRSGEGDAVLLQEGEFDISKGEKTDYYSGAKSGSSAEDFLYGKLLDCDDDIDASNYNIPVDDFILFYSNTVNDHPDLFYVSSSISFNYYPARGTVAHIYPEYSLTASEITAAKAVFDAGAAEGLSYVDSSMTDVQIAVILHDYICSRAHYPNITFNGDDLPIYHSAYGVFYDGEAVCAGYTLAYSYLMNEAGVECKYVTSEEMAHAWNLVKIDGSWYNVDCTWDDLDFSASISIDGCMSHTHFLKSDSKFATQICGFHYGSVNYGGYTATSTLYDTAFWDDVVSNIYAVDGDFYYLDPNTSTRYISLIRRTPAGVETVVKQFYVGLVYNYSSPVEDEDGNQYTNSFTDMLSRIKLLDNRFYIIVKKTLYSVNTAGTTYTITSSLSSYTMGIGKNDDNNLTFQYYDSPDTVNYIDKLQYFRTYLTSEKGSNYNNYPDINYDLTVNAKDYAMIIA